MDNPELEVDRGLGSQVPNPLELVDYQPGAMDSREILRGKARVGDHLLLRRGRGLKRTYRAL
jgi:hypothetical protein